MNKQTIIGLVIIGVILFGFSWYQNGQQKKLIEQRRIEDSIARANGRNTDGESATQNQPLPYPNVPNFDSLEAPVQAVNPTGIPQSNAEAEIFTVENDVMTIDFSTRGGIIADVVLKDYTKYGGDPLHMWKPGTEVFDVEFFLRREGRDAQVNTRDFNFDYSLTEDTDYKRVSMKLPVSQAAYLEFLYTIPQDDYMLGFEVRFVGMEGLLSNQSSFSIEWANTGLQNEKGWDNENTYNTISYHYPDVKGIEELGIARAGGGKEETEPSRVQWVAFKQQFFSSVLIADDAFHGAAMEFNTHQPHDGMIKDFAADLVVPMERDRDTYGFRMYMGPNKFSLLKEYGIALERLVPLGWFAVVSRGFVIPLFDWLSARGLSIGWVIFFITLIVRLIIFPLTFSSYKSSAKMRVIKPEVDEINKRYPDQADAMKKQQATMELYKRVGINPLAGCLPMLIQFPIIIAVFRFFPAAIELRDQSLWWAEDLSSYDSILNLGFKIPAYGDHISLFALLLAVSTFLMSWMNMRWQPAQAGMPGMKFMMLYLMPIMLLVWFNNYASGTSFYYVLANLFTIIQMYVVRLTLNEDALRKKMLSKPAKPKKKSGFMARLEEAKKAQQAAARSGHPARRK